MSAWFGGYTGFTFSPAGMMEKTYKGLSGRFEKQMQTLVDQGVCIVPKWSKVPKERHKYREEGVWFLAYDLPPWDQFKRAVETMYKKRCKLVETSKRKRQGKGEIVLVAVHDDNKVYTWATLDGEVQRRNIGEVLKVYKEDFKVKLFTPARDEEEEDYYLVLCDTQDMANATNRQLGDVAVYSMDSVQEKLARFKFTQEEQDAASQKWEVKERERHKRDVERRQRKKPRKKRAARLRRPAKK